MAGINFAKGLIGSALSQIQPQENKGSGQIITVREKVPLGRIDIAKNGNTLCMKTLGDEWRFKSANRSPIGILSANCIHSVYTGELKSCCLTGTSGNPKRTCDPSFTNSRETHSACESSWLGKCTGTAIGTDSDCQNWAKKNPDNNTTIQLLANFCANNTDSAFCRSLRTTVPKAFDSYMNIHCVGPNLDQSICVDWAKTKFGLIDARMMDFCTGKKAKGLCSCINSEVSELTKMFGSRAQVQCIDADCNLSGYKTAGMLSACPDVVDCTVVNFLKDNSGQINLSNQVINQNCSLTKTTSGTSTTSTNTNSSTSTVADDGTTKTFASSQTSSSTSEPPLPQTGNVSAQQPSPSDIVPPPEEQQGQQEERREQQTDSAGLSTFHIVLIILGAILLAIAIGVASYKFWPSKP